MIRPNGTAAALLCAATALAATALAAPPLAAPDLPAADFPAADANALLDGQLPDAPARALVQSKCLICHTSEYVTMQRLTEKQWQGTVDKMRKFGSPANDDEAKALVAYFSQYWKPDLPPQHSVLAPPPPGAVPRGTKAATPAKGAAPRK